MKKCILIFVGVFTLTFNLKAQEGFETILLSDATDSKKLMQAYFAPGMEGFINAMNSGWYHTAKVHIPFGFDLSIGLNGAIVPKKKELFNILNLGLTSVTSPSETASTFAGPNNTTPMTVNTTIDGQAVSATFDSPKGVLNDLPAKAIPAPIVQLSVGLPWKLEGMLRFLPETDIGEDDGSIKMLGLGIKKEITDWFGPMEKTPLHVSLLAAYTSMDVSYGIPDQPTGVIQAQNALTEFNLKAFTFQAIASLNFPVINIYGGIGYNSGSTKFATSGNFKGVYETGLPSPNNQVTKQLNVPSNLNFNSSGLTTTLGTRLSLGFFKIFGSYALQEYNTFSAGVAFGIR